MIARTALALLIAACALVPARAADVRVVYYDIHGRSARDLFKEMEAKGPVDKSSGLRFPAYTEWRVLGFSLRIRARELKADRIGCVGRGDYDTPALGRRRRCPGIAREGMGGF